jgi:hypothetical protein
MRLKCPARGPLPLTATLLTASGLEKREHSVFLLVSCSHAHVSLSIHPYFSAVATAAGQRHFCVDDGSSSESDEEGMDGKQLQDAAKKRKIDGIVDRDDGGENSLGLWVPADIMTARGSDAMNAVEQQ